MEILPSCKLTGLKFNNCAKLRVSHEFETHVPHGLTHLACLHFLTWFMFLHFFTVLQAFIFLAALIAFILLCAFCAKTTKGNIGE